MVKDFHALFRNSKIVHGIHILEVCHFYFLFISLLLYSDVGVEIAFISLIILQRTTMVSLEPGSYQTNTYLKQLQS